MKRIIWTSEEYNNEEARQEYVAECRKELDDENYDINDTAWFEMVNDQLSEVRNMLDVYPDGVIVAFADLGRWNGRCQGYRIFEGKVSEILYSDCDDAEWYADKYNVRCVASHHDGTNHYLYRVARDRDEAERIGEMIYQGEIDEEGFRKRTRSLLPYVAEQYGWDIPKSMKKTA